MKLLFGIYGHKTIEADWCQTAAFRAQSRSELEPLTKRLDQLNLNYEFGSNEETLLIEAPEPLQLTSLVREFASLAAAAYADSYQYGELKFREGIQEAKIRKTYLILSPEGCPEFVKYKYLGSCEAQSYNYYSAENDLDEDAEKYFQADWKINVPYSILSGNSINAHNRTELVLESAPDKVVRIINGDFLKHVFLPANVKSFNTCKYHVNGSGSLCEYLETIEVDPDNPYLSAIDGVLMNKDGTEILYIPNGKKGKLVIPSSMTVLKKSGILAHSIETIQLHDGVHEVKPVFFEYMDSLKAITADESNPQFSSADGFLYNKQKTELVAAPQRISYPVSFPAELSKIGTGAFRGRKYLEYFEVPQGVKTIGPQAFINCFNLKCLKLPDSVKKIADNIVESPQWSYLSYDPKKQVQFIVEKDSYAEKWCRENKYRYKYPEKMN